MYAPGPIGGGVFEENSSAWVRLETGVTLLEKVHEESSPEKVTVRVTASTLKSDPTSREEILAQRLMTFVEDWNLSQEGENTAIDKVWRDLVKHKLRLIPFGWLIKRAASKDAKSLEEAWSQG